MTFKQHVQKKYPNSYAVAKVTEKGRKCEFRIMSSKENGTRIGWAYTEAGAWKDAMLNTEEKSFELGNNGLTRRTKV